MARYYFNIRHKPGSEGVARDPDGEEIVDAGRLREHALEKARDLIERTRLESVSNWFDCSFEITDGDGRAVMTVPFADIAPDDDEGLESV